MSNVILMLIAVICLMCLFRPQWVLLACVIVGFLQDPLRKMIAGEPVFIILMVGIVFAAGMLGHLLQHGIKSLFEIQAWTPEFKVPILLFFFLLIFQALFSYISYESPTLTIIGIMAYVSPLLAISISYFSIYDTQRFKVILWCYAAITVLLALTVLLSFSGYEHSLLNEVGDGLLIYDQGTVLKAHSGFMRSSEIAGWHMGAAACFLVILSVASGKNASIVLCGIFVLLLLLAIILTGRRKMIMQFFVFLSLYSILYLYCRRAISVQILAGSCLALLLFGLTAFYVFPSLTHSEIDLYYARGMSVFGDVDARFRSLGIGSIKWAIDRVGWFGGGVGIAAQGTSYLGVDIAGGAGEGGLGKIVVELGVIGLLMCVWLAWITLRFFLKTLRFVSRQDSFDSRLAIGVVAFVLANVPTYIVASQVYGDLYILILLGILVGFIFALPKVMFIRRELEQRQAQLSSERIG